MSTRSSVPLTDKQLLGRRMPSTRTRFREMNAGADLYADGKPFDACANCYQRAGWLATEARDYRNEPGYSECREIIIH